MTALYYVTNTRHGSAIFTDPNMVLYSAFCCPELRVKVFDNLNVAKYHKDTSFGVRPEMPVDMSWAFISGSRNDNNVAWSYICNGKPVCDIVKTLLFTDNHTALLLAIYDILNNANSLGMKTVSIYTESKSIISIIQAEPRQGPNMTILSKIKQLMKQVETNFVLNLTQGDMFWVMEANRICWLVHRFNKTSEILS